jgi:hypothetical protein
MRRVKTLSLLTLTVLFLLTGCKDDKKKLIVGTWKIEDIKVSAEIPEEQKQFFDAMLAQMKEFLRLTYSADGTYQSDFMGKSNKGKWIMNDKQDEITAEDDSGKPMKYKIISLTKDRYEYVTMDEAQPITFVLVPGEAIDYEKEAEKMKQKMMEEAANAPVENQ